MAKYTDDQINEAIMLANQTGKVYVWETELFRNFIEHLPEPQGDWQECAFEDIRKGDRVRMVRAGRTTDFHLPVIKTHPTHLVLRDNTHCSNLHKADYYRIPAPVQHPDPAEHPVIIVRVASILNPKQAPLPMMWVEDSYMGGGYRLQPESITDWEPADIVPKVV